MKKPLHFLAFFLSFFSPRSCGALSSARPFHVGLILDLATPLGKMCEASVLVALDDFYKLNTHHATRLQLHTRDSREDVVGAASAAVELLKNVKVQAIVGPITSAQASFVIDLGEKSQVPILSFSARSPSLSPRYTPYFVRTALNDSAQVGAITATVQAFGWREAVVVYEDTEYGTGVIPSLVYAFQTIDARVAYHSVISPSASDDQMMEELYRLKTMQTRVFILHMSPSLGSRLFLKANESGLMAKGYAWIITDEVTGALDFMDPTVIESMQGVLGVKPHVPRSKELDGFTERWRTKMHQRHHRDSLGKAAVPSVLDLWAYDTTWALAMAAEQVEPSSYHFQNASVHLGNATDLDAVGVSQGGARLRDAILKTQHRGISGEFRLVDGQLQSSAYHIVNVVGTGLRTVAFWTPSRGITRRLNSAGGEAKLANPSCYSSGMAGMTVFWPGESTSVPRGWEIPTSGRKLRVGVPSTNGFLEFVKVDRDPLTNTTTVTGYSIDVFDAVMKRLPYAVPYEYIPFPDPPGKTGWTYNDLVYKICLEKFDAVVGDVTIVENRSRYVDFALPYSESGVSMIVPMRKDVDGNAWIFLKPLTVDLWLTSLAFFLFTGFVVWLIEHQINRDFRGPPSQHIGNIVYFAFSTLVFSPKERVVSNLSRCVVIFWMFVVLILTSSYTASLSSMLTVQQLRPTVADVQQLLRNGDYVGYQGTSFVQGLLTRMNFDHSKLRPYYTPDEYAEALSKGSRNGGVAAIFDEIPYIKIFLAQKGRDFAMLGPTYKTDGFGFAFPRGSPLVADVSRAVLNVTQGDIMVGIERKWFGDLTTNTADSTTLSSSSLSVGRLWGLFLVSGAVSTSALLAFLVKFLCENWGDISTRVSGRSLSQQIVAVVKQLDRKDPTLHGSRKANPLRLHSPCGDESSRRVASGLYAHGSQGDRNVTGYNESSSDLTGEGRLSPEICSHCMVMKTPSAPQE